MRREQQMTECPETTRSGPRSDRYTVCEGRPMRSGMTSRLITRLRAARRDERGATLVEYALGVALLVVVTIPAVAFVRDESTDVVDRRADSLGAPDLDETGTPVTLPPPTTTLPGGSVPPPPESVVTVTFTGSSSTVQRNVEWAATIGFQALDDTGNERELVTITGQWAGASIVTPIPMTCATNLAGRCAVTLRSLPCPTATSVTFTVSSVSGEGVTYSGTLPVVITVNRPTGTGQNACG